MRYTKSKFPYLVVLFLLLGTALADRLEPQDDALEIAISAESEAVGLAAPGILAQVPTY
ncbi:MAG: hypothetical protein AAFQ98_21485 [Bacteroidota bacterium]